MIAGLEINELAPFVGSRANRGSCALGLSYHKDYDTSLGNRGNGSPVRSRTSPRRRQTSPSREDTLYPGQRQDNISPTRRDTPQIVRLPSSRDTPQIVRLPSSNKLERTPSVSTILQIQEAAVQLEERSYKVSKADLQIGDQVVEEGAWGCVFKGRCRGQSCAVKKLKPRMGVKAAQRRMLLIEATVLCHVGYHKNLVRFIGACLEDPNDPSIVQEYIDGGNLEAFLDKQRPKFKLGDIVVRSWSIDIFSALHYLHCLDPIIVHGELKPSNILLAQGGKVLKLAEFGIIARAARDEESEWPKANYDERYMAPEVQKLASANNGCRRSEVYTDKADIFSAGTIVWCILTGATSPHRQGPDARPDAAPARRRWIELSALVERMCDPHPDARPTANASLRCLKALEPRAGGNACAIH